jgi:hypothetical protein
MIGAALALLVAALPDGAARYRVEIAGERVGAAELSIRCAGDACRVRWATRLRLPADAGGAIQESATEVAVGRDGRALRGEVRGAHDGLAWSYAAVEGAVPVSLVEIALRAARAGDCIDVFEEETRVRGRACVRRAGAPLELEVVGVAERVVPAKDGFPADVAIPAQATRYVRDPGAAVPDRAPTLYGTAVPGPSDPARAASFCDIPLDAPPPAAPRAAPPPRADGASCREKTAAYLAAAQHVGLEGRTAVGVAWDGARFVWHAWAEVRAGDAWIPIDPSFEQAPAAGPRFTVARHADGDRAASLEAGRRILACWGRVSVLAR